MEQNIRAFSACRKIMGEVLWYLTFLPFKITKSAVALIIVPKIEQRFAPTKVMFEAKTGIVTFTVIFFHKFLHSSLTKLVHCTILISYDINVVCKVI